MSRASYCGGVSIPVDVADLKRTLEDFGSGYLLTTAGGRVKVVTVDPEPADGGLLVAAPGRGTLANVGENPAVTLVFPPRKARGHTLLVDGTATASGADLRVEPASAVLHRPASHADGPVPAAGCGHDCAPVT